MTDLSTGSQNVSRDYDGNNTGWDYISAVQKLNATVTRSEKHLLLTYALHADNYGESYCGNLRIMDETGMSKPTLSKTKAEIREKGLALIQTRWVHPDTGHKYPESWFTKRGLNLSGMRQTTDLVRLNLRALRALERPAKDYGDRVSGPQIEFPAEGEGSKTSPLPETRRTTRGGGVKNLTPNTQRNTQNDPPPRATTSEDVSAGDVTGSEEEEAKTKVSSEATTFVTGLTGSARFGLRAAELAEIVQQRLDAGWTATQLQEANDWPSATPTKTTPFNAHRKWLLGLTDAPAAVSKAKASTLDLMPCPHPDHGGQPITHTVTCIDDFADEVWHWRRAQRQATA